MVATLSPSRYCLAPRTTMANPSAPLQEVDIESGQARNEISASLHAVSVCPSSYRVHVVLKAFVSNSSLGNHDPQMAGRDTIKLISYGIAKRGRADLRSSARPLDLPSSWMPKPYRTASDEAGPWRLRLCRSGVPILGVHLQRQLTHSHLWYIRAFLI